MMAKSKILSGYCGIKIIEKRGHGRITSKKNCYLLTLNGHAVSSFTANPFPLMNTEFPCVFISGNYAIITGIYLLVPFSTLYRVAV